MRNAEKFGSQTVDILVATYNGQEYIRAQLLSLLFQTHEAIRVLVHDDGSTDATREIVREIAAKDSRVKLIEDGVTCGNAGKNFMHLLKFSTVNAVMFCDQDDIWFDNKVAVMLEGLKRNEPSVPQVVYSEAYAWYANRGIDGKAMNTHPTDLKSFLFLNGAFQGCATLFNGAMRNLLRQWQGPLWMHDHTLALIALSLGRVTYMLTPLMLYRRHPESVTGKSPLRGSVRTALIAHRAAPVVCQGSYEAVERFLNLYGGKLSQKNRYILREYLKMRDDSFIKRVFAVLRNRFTLRGSTGALLIKLVLRPYIKAIKLGSGGGLDLTGLFAVNADYEAAA